MKRSLFYTTLLLTTLSLLASAVSFKKEDHIKIKQGIGTIYNIGFEEGLKDIQKIAQNPKEQREDSWLWDGEKWTDVGLISLDDKVIKIPFIGRMKKTKDNLLVHNHPMSVFEEDSISYFPPSGTDYKSIYYTNKNSDGQIETRGGVVDAKGLWTYSVKKDISEFGLDILSLGGESYHHIFAQDQCFFKKDFSFSKEYEMRRKFLGPQASLEFRTLGEEK